MKTILMHPFGNQNVRAALEGLYAEDLLAEFHVSINFMANKLAAALLPAPLFLELSRRSFPSHLHSITHSYPVSETGRLAANKLGLSRLTAHESGIFCVDRICTNLDKRLARHIQAIQSPSDNSGLGSVYAYEDAALYSFRAARQIGWNCFYDLPIGYWRAAREMMQNAKEQWPGWANTMNGLSDSDEKLWRKDEELRLADVVFVASRFTADTLRMFPHKSLQVEVIPYGFPPVNKDRKYLNTAQRPLKLLFVGSLSERKGLAELFFAVAPLGRHVQLTIVGNKTGGQCNELDAFLEQHHWIPSLPHAAILDLMANHDVLVFPSLFEGFGLVITEAMSQGTPVITTPRTAGPDLITHGINGWIIEPGSVCALRQQIEILLANRQLVVEAGIHARIKAASRPWASYGRELAAAIRKYETVKKKQHRLPWFAADTAPDSINH